MTKVSADDLSGVTAVIFDCFGVLYPTYVDNFFDRHSELFKDGTRALDHLNLQLDLGQITQAEFYKSIEKATGIPANRVKSEMEQDLVVDSRLIKLITHMKTKYKLGLLSNAGQEEISVIYRDGIADLFDVICVSYEIGDVKPNSKIFNTCLSKLGVSAAESVFIDDNTENLAGARRLGIKTIHYPTFGDLPNSLHSLSKIPGSKLL
jgi:HAD superfamily hydrolase (TIGR01509 family)